MGDNKQRDSMDEAMFEIRDRLKLVSEKLRMSRQAATKVTRPVEEARMQSSCTVTPTAAPAIGRGDYIPERLPADRWPDFLKKLSRRLDAVSGDTENEFICIGACLSDIRKRANKITGISEKIAHMITDRQISSNINELKLAVSRMREWLSTPAAQEGMSDHHLNARMLVDKTGICLNTLERKYFRSEAILQDFNNKTGEVASSIDKVIESLQYSDITRQNIEHVKGEVNTIEARLVGVGFGHAVIDLGGVRELVGEVGGTCVALSSELRKACAEFDRAVQSITSNLLIVSKDTTEMSEDIMQVVRGDSDSGKSFMSAIGNWLNSLMNTLSSFGPGGGGACGIPSLCNDRDNGIIAPAMDGYEVPKEFGSQVLELCTVITSLRTINGNILYQLSLMEDESNALTREIETAVGKFGSNNRVADMGEGVAAGLDKLAEEAAIIAPSEVSYHAAGQAARLRNISGRSIAGAGMAGKAGDDGLADDNVIIF